MFRSETKSKFLAFLAVIALFSAIVFAGGCLGGSDSKKTEIPAIYRTQEEWQQRWTVAEYHPNEEITDGKYDKNLAAECTNGIFVGQYLQDNKVKAWRGIPFAKIPARFERPVMPDKSDKVYQALYFGKSSLQNGDESEPAGYYKQGEFDCLTLTVYTGNNDIKNKPVFVYVHGGAYSCGGTTDPAYDLTNLAYYHPDCVFIDVTYRLGVLGHINLAAKDKNGKYLLSDYEENADKYNTANNLSILDLIQSLRWVKENAAAFGGNAGNVTIGGESAGGGFVSNILMMASDPDNKFIDKDEKLFSKVFSMSGGINQYNSPNDAAKLTEALIKFCKEKGKDGSTIAGLKSLTFEELGEFWKNNDMLAVFNVLDGIVLPEDPYKIYNKYVGKDYIVLQGATTNEYDYFRAVFKDMYKKFDITHEDCAKAVLKYLTEPTEVMPDLVVTDEFKKLLGEYFEALKKENITSEDEQLNTLMNDHYLQIVNYYMAQKQTENGGTTYCYAFDEPYNPPYDACKAGHAIDCCYLFGNFNGGKALGTKEQVDFSRKYQNMLANFMKTGNPSTDDVDWKPFSKETGYVTFLNKERIECIKGYNADRIQTAIKMFDESEAMKYALPWSYMFPMAYDIAHPKK